jgi:hypothetical protein
MHAYQRQTIVVQVALLWNFPIQYIRVANQSSLFVSCSSIHETHGFVHDRSKALGLTVFPTSDGRKLRHLDAEICRFLYCWCEISRAC